MQHLTVIVSGYFLHKIIYALLMRPELCRHISSFELKSRLNIRKNIQVQKMWTTNLYYLTKSVPVGIY